MRGTTTATTKSQQPLSFTIPDLMFSNDVVADEEKRCATPPKKRDQASSSSSSELSPTVVEEKTTAPPVSMADVMEEWMKFEGNDLSHLWVNQELTGFICKKCDNCTVMHIDTMAKHCNGMRHKDALEFVGSLFEKGHMKPKKDFIVSMNEHRDFEVDCRICDETVLLRKSDSSWASTVANHLKRKGHVEYANRLCEKSKEDALYGKSKSSRSRKRHSRPRPSSGASTPVKKNKPLVPPEEEPVAPSPVMEDYDDVREKSSSPPPPFIEHEESPPPPMPRQEEEPMPRQEEESPPKKDKEQSLRPMSEKDKEEEDMREYLLEVRKETFRKLMEEHVKNEFAQLIKTLK